MDHEITSHSIVVVLATSYEGRWLSDAVMSAAASALSQHHLVQFVDRSMPPDSDHEFGGGVVGYRARGGSIEFTAMLHEMQRLSVPFVAYDLVNRCKAGPVTVFNTFHGSDADMHWAVPHFLNLARYVAANDVNVIVRWPFHPGAEYFAFETWLGESVERYPAFRVIAVADVDAEARAGRDIQRDIAMIQAWCPKRSSFVVQGNLGPDERFPDIAAVLADPSRTLMSHDLPGESDPWRDSAIEFLRRGPLRRDDSLGPGPLPSAQFISNWPHG